MTRVEVVTITRDRRSSMVERATEMRAYAGIFLRGVERVHAWLTDAGTGDRLPLATTGAFSIGRAYLVDVTRAEGTLRVPGAGRPAGDERVSLAVRIRAARGAVLDRFAGQEGAAGPRDGMNEALKPLRALARTMRAPAEGAAIIAHVGEQLWAALFASSHRGCADSEGANHG